MIQDAESYPGLTGVPDLHRDRETFFLSQKERARLGYLICVELSGDHPPVSDPVAYINELAWAAYLCRGWARIADEARLVNRRTNLVSYIARLNGGRTPAQLTQANQIELGMMAGRSLIQGESELERSEALLRELTARRTRRGRRNMDELDYTADAVARAIERYSGKPVTTVRGGTFCLIFAVVVSVATGKQRTDTHTRIERYLSRAVVVQESQVSEQPGVWRPRVFVPARIATKFIS